MLLRKELLNFQYPSMTSVNLCKLNVNKTSPVVRKRNRKKAIFNRFIKHFRAGQQSNLLARKGFLLDHEHSLAPG